MKVKKPGGDPSLGMSVGGTQLKPHKDKPAKAPTPVGKERGKAKATSSTARQPGAPTKGAPSKTRQPKGSQKDVLEPSAKPSGTSTGQDTPSTSNALQKPGTTSSLSATQEQPSVTPPSLTEIDEINELALTGNHPKPPPAQTKQVRLLSARNRQIGSRDAALQTQLIQHAWAQQYGTKPKPSADDAALPGQAALNNHFNPSVNLETTLVNQLQAIPGVVLEVPDNPVHVFVTPHEGNSATTRLTGDYVVKGYDDEKQAEVEWLGTKFMQLTGEISPDMHRASSTLRDQIMAADPAFKKADTFKSKPNPALEGLSMLDRMGLPMFVTEVIPATSPQHCLVMPRLFASNIGNIAENPTMRASFAKNIERHTQEMGRMAFKDILLGNSDRIIRMYPGKDSPPYLPDVEEIVAGSPMNTGNIMFQTVEGEVHVDTGFAIDNFGSTVNRVGEPEGLAKELRAFEFYMQDVARSIKEGSGADSAPHHLTNQVMESLRGALDGPELTKMQGAPPLYDMPDQDYRAAVITGMKRGWVEVLENQAALGEFLQSSAEDDDMKTDEGTDMRSLLLQKVEIAERVFKESGLAN